MSARTYRSGSATMLRVVGPLIAVVGVLVFVPLPVLLWLSSEDASVLLMLLFVPIGVIAGVLLFLAGQRSSVTVSTEDVSWRTLTSARRTVPFSAVRGVEVPTARRGPTGVRLHLLDGSVVAVGAVAMSSGEGGNSADGGYLRAAQAITAAHAAWWARHPGHR